MIKRAGIFFGIFFFFFFGSFFLGYHIFTHQEIEIVAVFETFDGTVVNADPGSFFEVSPGSIVLLRTSKESVPTKLVGIVAIITYFDGTKKFVLLSKNNKGRWI